MRNRFPFQWCYWCCRWCFSTTVSYDNKYFCALLQAPTLLSVAGSPIQRRTKQRNKNPISRVHGYDGGGGGCMIPWLPLCFIYGQIIQIKPAIRFFLWYEYLYEYLYLVYLWVYPRVSVSSAGYLNTRTMPPQGAACQKILMNYTHYKWERFFDFPGSFISPFFCSAICWHFCLYFWTIQRCFGKKKLRLWEVRGAAEKFTMKWFKQCFAILRFTPVWVQTINIECRKYIPMAMVSNLNLFLLANSHLFPTKFRKTSPSIPLGTD